MNQKELVMKTYQRQKVVESFDKERGETESDKYKHYLESEFLFKSMRSLNPKWAVWASNLNILDVGCGTGRMLRTSLEESAGFTRYVGLDTSKEMTKILKDKAKFLEAEKEVTIKIGNATNIPFKDNTFDLTFSYHLLWHLPPEEQEKILKEMLRVTKKGGIILFDIVNENFIWNKIRKLFGFKTEGIYKLRIKDIEKIIIKDKEFTLEKLNDAPLSDGYYKIFNIVNHLRKILPNNLFHMIYFRVIK